MIYIPRWKVLLVIIICLTGVIFALPNILTPQQMEHLPTWMPQRQINLGLDLQGGSHLLLEVDLATANKERMTSLLDEVRSGLRTTKIGYTNIKAQKEGISFKLRDNNDFAQVKSAIKNIDRELVVEESGDFIVIKFPQAAWEARQRLIVDQSIEIVRRRIDETGTKEPTIQRQGNDRIVVQLPGLSDPSHVKNLLGQTAKLSFQIVDDSVPYVASLQDRVPSGTEILTVEEKNRDGETTTHYLPIRKQILLGGDRLIDAQPQRDQEFNKPIVSFTFDAVGGKKFREITGNNIGKRLAIVLDNKVISAPSINSAIGSQGIITGQFTVQQTQDLALLMRAGALPAPLSVIEERTVGPDLGADSIKAGNQATVIAVIMVALFMVLAYSLFGLIADIALIFNLILLFAALSVLQATLTLPGIAGIALTIGMAVDANVLIYERIKEEIRAGKKPIVAIDAGYNRAISTIIDSNLTTLIGAALLFNFGAGPIKSFAVTLALGIIISLFTAISVTKQLVALWFNRKKPTHLPI